MTITIKSTGRRHYLNGNTYPIKHLLKSAGCTWDADRKAWWTGDKTKAEDLVAKAANVATPSKPSAPADKSVSRTANILLARVEYKGKGYYAVTEAVRCQDGANRIKLAFCDGSSSFWATAQEVRLVKRYAEPQSIVRIERYIAERKAGGSAPKSGGSSGVRAHAHGPTKTCWECGCAFTVGDAKRHGGSWSESYCGC